MQFIRLFSIRLKALIIVSTITQLFIRLITFAIKLELYDV